MQTNNIKEMTIEQLKAIAYDQIELAERCRANISMIQAEIKEREKITMPTPKPGDSVPPPAPLEVK